MTPFGRISIEIGDITTYDVDMIVNAANAALCGGGGVDGAIHDAAGEELLRACLALGGCKTGDAKVTPGFDLPARWIAHAVGPVWYGGHRDEPSLLASCYRRSLELALEHGCKSIAFPAISTGAYRFPRPKAARIAIDTVVTFLSNDDALDRVIFVCAEHDVRDEHKKALAQMSLA